MSQEQSEKRKKGNRISNSNCKNVNVRNGKAREKTHDMVTYHNLTKITDTARIRYINQ